MLLGLSSAYLTSIGQAAMWARFIDQTQDRSMRCLQNGAIAQVALHQMALTGLAFCFFDALGTLSLSGPVVGGLCCVPAVWTVLHATQMIEREPYQEGIQLIMLASLVSLVGAAVLFAYSGASIFGAAFGGLLILGHLRRVHHLSLHLTLGSEGAEFITANIAAVLIGAWYHRLRAMLDVGLRARDYYKLRIKTEPIIPKVVSHDISAQNIDKLAGICGENWDFLRPTHGHIDWPSIELPEGRPKGYTLDSYRDLADKVFILDHIRVIRGGLVSSDDCFDKNQTDESVLAYAKKKVAPWIKVVEKGNSVFANQTDLTQRYALWLREELEKKSPQEQAGAIAQVLGNVTSAVAPCPEHIIDLVERVYLSTACPDTRSINAIISYVLQGQRRHILHQFLESLKVSYPNWMLDSQERHLVNLLISILNQRGIHLGLPEEETARRDSYYGGSFVETLLWHETQNFRDFFIKRYTASEMLSAMKKTPWEGSLREAINDWTSSLDDCSMDMDKSVSHHAQKAYDIDSNIKNSYIFGLLIHLGALTFPKEVKEKLEKLQNSDSAY